MSNSALRGFPSSSPSPIPPRSKRKREPFGGGDDGCDDGCSGEAGFFFSSFFFSYRRVYRTVCTYGVGRGHAGSHFVLFFVIEEVAKKERRGNIKIRDMI